MTTESDPIMGNWYCHLDKGQRFRVVAIDEKTETGPLDIGNLDDLGTNITDTSSSDWDEPLDVFEPRSERGKEE